MGRYRGLLPALGLWVVMFGPRGRSEEPAPSQEQIVSKIEKAGGLVQVDEERPGKPAVLVNLVDTKATDSEVRLIKGLSFLTHLHLSNTRVTDKGLRHLSLLRVLIFLDLDGTRITDRGLVHIAGIKSLILLNLRKTRVTPTALRKLQKALPDTRIIH